MSEAQLKQVVFPVAGLGSRFLPVTKSIPKEMLPIIDKPLIQFAIEEAIEAGIEKIVFITSHTKKAIERIERIMNNLVDNAIKYSEKGSEITISTSNEGKDYIKVAVEDNGEGISPEDQDQIFSRFFRTASARATDNQGSGLGLAIVKHLVNNLNGEVGLESKPEKGSIFWFTVPISQ